MGVANWLVGLLFLTSMAVKVFWALELITAAHLRPRKRRWRILRDGTLHLGWYFLISSLLVYGVLGFLLFSQPNETVPLWYAAPMALLTVECILAWLLLGPGAPEEDE